MSTDEKGGFFSQVKNQIITGIGVIITAAGSLLVTNMEAMFSPKEDENKVVVQDSVVTQQPIININIPEQKTIVKEVPAKEPVKPTEKVYESW